MVSQFVSSHNVQLLSNLPYTFPKHIHAIGRLDSKTEGLLLLTNNRSVTRLLFQGNVPHTRTYIVQVQNIVTDATVLQLQNGISFAAIGGQLYTTKPCIVEIIEEPNFAFATPYTCNKYIRYTWLKITLTEGKYHQVRKMVAAVNHRCVRLIRVSIENITLGNLLPGQVQEMEEHQFFAQLNITNWQAAMY